MNDESYVIMLVTNEGGLDLPLRAIEAAFLGKEDPVIHRYSNANSACYDLEQGNKYDLLIVDDIFGYLHLIAEAHKKHVKAIAMNQQPTVPLTSRTVLKFDFHALALAIKDVIK